MKRQVADCEQLAARRGWTVVDYYVDDDVSAYSGRSRPQYRRLLDDITAGGLDAVVVWHLDRLHRQPRELEEFFEVTDAARMSLLASVSGDVDLGTHDGRFTARILGAVASKESDDKSRRIKRKAEELAQAGKVGGGGTRPYGYADDRRTVVESEAVVVRECVRRLLAGEAIRSVCADLNERRVPTVQGGEWKTQTLRRLVGSARISGQREHNGEIVATAEWPAIVTPAETARIRTLLNDPSRRTNRTARRYLLVRLLRCELCGELLVSRPTSGGTRRYVCAKGPNFTGCGHLYAQAEPLEQLVAESVMQRLDTPELAQAVNGGATDPDAERIEAEIADAKSQLEELAVMWAEREIDRSEWIAAREPIEARLTAARKRLGRFNRFAALDGHIGQGSALQEQWPTMPLTRQRAIVAAVLDHVVVSPGRRGLNRFDPSRFRPVWRI